MWHGWLEAEVVELGWGYFVVEELEALFFVCDALLRILLITLICMHNEPHKPDNYECNEKNGTHKLKNIIQCFCGCPVHSAYSIPYARGLTFGGIVWYAGGTMLEALFMFLLILIGVCIAWGIHSYEEYRQAKMLEKVDEILEESNRKKMEKVEGLLDGYYDKWKKELDKRCGSTKEENG